MLHRITRIFTGYEAVDTNHYRRNSHRVWIQVMPVAIASALFMVLGTLTGRSLSRPDNTYGLLLPYGSLPEIWHHNLTFSMKPTPESEDAWSSLIPVGRGFVHHPEVAPYMNSIAVFHQLHCLHGIRLSYYNMLHKLEVADGGPSDPYLEAQGVRVNIGHLQHCFDYLRRALMCAADTNLEVINPETDATTGWGSQRVCRDYDSVMKWAESWANSTAAGIN